MYPGIPPDMAPDEALATYPETTPDPTPDTAPATWPDTAQDIDLWRDNPNWPPETLPATNPDWISETYEEATQVQDGGFEVAQPEDDKAPSSLLGGVGSWVLGGWPRASRARYGRSKRQHRDYTALWISPLEVELIAALEMLDTQHRRLPQRRVDPNVYALGEIAGHNIVIVGMPQTGNCSAATVMAHARWTFPNLRFCLLVGIGGGVPVTTDNGRIRLGDVVVSKPTGPYPGVMQYHRGKAQAGHFEPTGALPPPPAVLLSAAQALAADRARSATDPLASNLARIDTTIEGLRKYQSPGRAQDHLYRPTYPHQVAGRSCSECMCDPARRVRVPRFRGDDRVAVHRGTIASGELVMRSGKLRDKLAMEYDVLCFETEAAGVLTDFPCMVVRGISDYSDSHKNDLWQGYAAATAAAYARELFSYIPHNHEDDPES